jgi:glycosyltransferase involved in cell wall biosynthesis
MPLLQDVTIVVPTRNEAANIRGFLASLPPDIALIVVDKSTDETRELIKRHRPLNTAVHDYQGTLTKARQLGAERARTSWLLFTDADIVFADDYFARLSQLLADSAPAEVLYGPKLSRDEYRLYYRGFAAGQWLSQVLRMPAASGSNLVVSAKAFHGVRGFDTQLACNEDSELAWRIKRFGYRCRFDKKLVVFAIDHRRLRRSRLLKATHTLLRCAVLYFGLLPQRWRGHDWGYWSETPPPRQP